MKKPKNTPEARSSASGADGVIDIAIRLRDALEEEERLMALANESERAGKHSAEIYCNNAFPHLTDEVYTLRDMLSLERAKTLTGAAVQVVETLLLVDRVWDQIPDDHETPQLKRDRRAIDRLLYSALAVIDGLADRKIDDVTSPHYFGRHCDPWPPVEERCEQLKTEATS